jgi:hypothetical protein
MDKYFLPFGADIEILNEVGKWKIIDLSQLESGLNRLTIGYRAIAYRVKKLQDKGLINCFYLGRKRKQLYLSSKGLKAVGLSTSSQMSEQTLSHDMFTSFIVREFLKMPFFVYGKMYDEIISSDVEPDGLLIGGAGDLDIKVGLEVELTQKEAGRVRRKFANYSHCKGIDYCLYVTDSETIERAYRKYLMMMSQDVQSKIIIMRFDSLRVQELKVINQLCFFKGREVKLEQIFS